MSSVFFGKNTNIDLGVLFDSDPSGKKHASFDFLAM